MNKWFFGTLHDYKVKRQYLDMLSSALLILKCRPNNVYNQRVNFKVNCYEYFLSLMFLCWSVFLLLEFVNGIVWFVFVVCFAMGCHDKRCKASWYMLKIEINHNNCDQSERLSFSAVVADFDSISLDQIEQVKSYPWICMTLPEHILKSGIYSTTSRPTDKFRVVYIYRDATKIKTLEAISFAHLWKIVIWFKCSHYIYGIQYAIELSLALQY